MRTLLLAMTVVSAAALTAEPAFAQDKTRFAEQGVVFDYPKDWKVKTTKTTDGASINATNGKGTQMLIGLHPADIDPKALRELMDKTFRKQFEGKLVKGSEKSVKRKLAGSVQEGIAMDYEVSTGVVSTFELFAFPLPSKKRVVFVLFGHFHLYAEAAKKDLAMIADSLAEGMADAVIAEAGFNDKEGGAGEPGWVTAWGPASPRAVIQKKIVFEGDAALHLSNTGFTRRLSVPQKGRFVVEQHVQVPAGGGVIAYIRNGEGPKGDGPAWYVLKGRFSVLQDGKWVETPFASEAGKWHKVVITVDVPKQSWEFSVDDRKFESKQPLPFRSKEDRLDTVRFQCENAPGIYIDAVRVLREPTAAEKK
jgi:hypothetical protein